MLKLVRISVNRETQRPFHNTAETVVNASNSTTWTHFSFISLGLICDVFSVGPDAAHVDQCPNSNRGSSDIVSCVPCSMRHAALSYHWQELHSESSIPPEAPSLPCRALNIQPNPQTLRKALRRTE